MKKRLVSLLKRGVTSYEGRNTFVIFFFFACAGFSQIQRMTASLLNAAMPVESLHPAVRSRVND